VADDGIGLPEGETWPKPGKLGALIARSLTENAKAQFNVASSPGEGTKVTIVFTRSAAAS
ncbi:HAMP domain-containing histidine kinase, partial [Mesorhizobium sp. M6A.T.Ce.TU.002.03.1.1]